MTQEKLKNNLPGLAVIKSASLRIGTVTLYEGNLLYFILDDEVTITVEDVIEMSEKNMELTGDNMYFSIVVPGYRSDLTKEAREFDFYKELNRKPTCIAEAIIVTELPTRIVVDFYYKFRNFPYPIKVFSKEEKALAWFSQIRPFLKG
jgi:hypothetical protein